MTHLNLTIRNLFYIVWFFSLILQAYFTEITADEAYYFMYSKKLAWGYFDHPPVIALMIKFGYYFFANELGVRIVSAILSTLTIFFAEKIINPKEKGVFFMLISSVGILHFIGFFAIPDAPLLFTFAVFLLLYKRFLFLQNIQNAILLGCSIALMCLSKYHGIIIIGLTVISNLKLLKNRFFWLAILGACIILIPHFIWQINLGFPSVKYHFFERSKEAYKLAFTAEYLASQLFVLGPITGIIFFIAAVKIKANNQFEKTLKFLFWGGYTFFFLMSFKGKIEAHWTLFIVLPALYFGYFYLIKLSNKKQIVNLTFLISILLIITVRIIITLNIKEDNFLFKVTKQFNNKATMLAIKQQAKNRAVAFMNSYQNASLYSFHTKSNGFSLNNIMGRKNQFDIWNVEDKYRGQNIMLIPNYNIKNLNRIQGTSKIIKYKFIDNFQSFSKITIKAFNLPKKAAVLDSLRFSIHLSTVKKSNVNLNANLNYPTYLYYQFFKGKHLIKEKRVFKVSNNMLDNKYFLDVITPSKPGNYNIYLTLKTGWLPQTINSNRYTIRVADIKK